MKKFLATVLIGISAPLTATATTGKLLPAGAVLTCYTSEAKISSRNTNVGDPVLCKVAHTGVGNRALPYGVYLGGEFSDFNDPGHIYGKGWMTLAFDHLVIGDHVVPIDAKVVDVPKYDVDKEGRIHGKGHATRDTILWTIPLLWPVDMIKLPRKGPRPTLRSETMVMVKVMGDVIIPQELISEANGYDAPTLASADRQVQMQAQAQQKTVVYVQSQQVVYVGDGTVPDGLTSRPMLRQRLKRVAPTPPDSDGYSVYPPPE